MNKNLSHIEIDKLQIKEDEVLVIYTNNKTTDWQFKVAHETAETIARATKRVVLVLNKDLVAGFEITSRYELAKKLGLPVVTKKIKKTTQPEIPQIPTTK